LWFSASKSLLVNNKRSKGSAEFVKTVKCISVEFTS
jgi:hypothetical protein